MAKKETKKILWLFLPTDYKAMTEQLEEMAKKGWLLEKVSSFTATFRAIPPQNLKYHVDILPSTSIFDLGSNTPDEEYIKAWAEAGWDFLASKDYLQFFSSVSHHQPLANQNRESRDEIINGKVLPKEYLNIFIILIMLLYSLLKGSSYSYQKMLSFTGVTQTYIFPLTLIPVLAYAAHLGIWQIKLRNSIRKGIAMPNPSLTATKARARFYYLSLAVIVGFLVLSLLGDGLTVGPFVLIGLLPILMGGVIGFWLKKYFKTSGDDKKTKVSILVVTLIATAIIAQLIVMIIISGAASLDFENIEKVPLGYNVLRLEDFPNYEQGNISMRTFTKKASPLVPKSYGYWELDKNKLSIRSEYFYGVTPYFAKKIFAGKLAEETRFRKAIPASAKKWQADDVYYLGDSFRVIFRKGNVVGYIESDWDLDDDQIRGLIHSKFSP